VDIGAKFMNQKLRYWVKQTRKRLKRDCPTIYDTCFAHLSDEELVKALSKHKTQLASNRGEVIQVVLESDGVPLRLGSFQVPGDPRRRPRQCPMRLAIPRWVCGVGCLKPRSKL
jgi:hypothetical protein